MIYLDVVDEDQCDAAGVPLDWDRCRACRGSGRGSAVPTHVWLSLGRGATELCPYCHGCGSLRALALAARRAWAQAEREFPGAARSVRWRDGEVRAVLDAEYGIGADVAAEGDARCEDCGHPMSEGAWSAAADRLWKADLANLPYSDKLHGSVERLMNPVVHYSLCDEGCRHGGPTRTVVLKTGRVGLATESPETREEASWRQVDVRTLGWPHDLRAHKLKVLCLRCYAATKAQER